MTENGDWTAWSHHVLIELERLNECYNKVDERLNAIEKNLATNNVKIGFQATLYGILGGAIPVFITIAIWFIQNTK
jgi:outer membrane protease